MKKYMEEALLLAKKAFNEGEVPIGAVVIENGKVIGRGYNQKENTNDPTSHAEINAIKEAARKKKTWHLENCELYVTIEPCMMCSGAIIQSRIKKVTYGAKNEKFGYLKTFVLNKHNHSPEIDSGVLEEKCKEIMRSFFENTREK